MSALNKWLEANPSLYEGKYPPFIPPDNIETMTAEEIEAYAEISWANYTSDLMAKPQKRTSPYSSQP